jgi:hypothetical protein
MQKTVFEPVVRQPIIMREKMSKQIPLFESEWKEVENE